MMAAVFTMQPIGQALAQMVGMWVLLRWDAAYGIDAKQCGLNSLYDDECKQFVDMIWRIVVGSGAIPAVLAIIFRFYLFDSGVYKFDVEDRPEEAMMNIYRVYGTRDYDTQAPREPLLEQPPLPKERGRGQDMPIQFSLVNLRKFFIEDGNYMYLIGTAATWFLLDVTFFGLALDNRATLADMWAIKNEPVIDDRLPCWESSLEGGISLVPEWANTGLPVWQTDGKHPCTTIYDVLFEQAIQYLLAVSIGSILGSLCFVLIVDRVPRRQWMVASFAILAALLFITGIVCYCVFETPRAPATIICLGISLFMFNCGPNPLNFIIPAEIFPTCYRCTCHGISAAAGKTGSIMAILLIYVINDSYKSTSRQGLILLLFCAVAALGSICAWAYLPEVQRHIRVGPKGEILSDGSIESPEAGGGSKRRNQRRNGDGGDQDGYKEEDGDEDEIGVEERKHLHRNWLTFWREDAMLENETLEELGEGRRRALQEGQVFSLEDRFADLKRRKIWRWAQALKGPSAHAS
jgi:PHS family inorganic phosphate transporter-like MFS transporter